VGLRELEVAYKSRDYTVYRTDIELLAKLPYSVALQKAHKDLWCPFDIKPVSGPAEQFAELRRENVGKAAIEASLNAAERSAYKELTVKTSARQEASKVIPLSQQKSLAERLKDDAAWFEEKL
jgi:hypothetical protein